jgi:predicted dienelactone hydrolase
MRRFIIPIVAMWAMAASAATWEEATGPWPTAIAAAAGPEGRYYIHRPKALKANAHPVAVLGVGTGSHPRNYDALAAQLASHGIIVIADTDPYQADGNGASAAVDWLLAQNEASGSEYFHALIPSRVLAIGHSSGANGAILASVRNPKITSLLLYAPALDTARPSELSVPTFYVAGSLDTTVNPALVKASYEQSTKAAAWYAESRNQRHIGFAANPFIQYFTRAWAYAQLFDDAGTARECFYGAGWTLRRAPNWNEALRNDKGS